MVDKLKNSFAVFAVALAVLFVGVQFASAALTQTQKEALMALGFTSSQIAALEGLSMGGSSCSGSYVHTMTLKVGSKGSQVAAMQAVVGATADGNFGPMTKAKVMSFQSMKGLVADGVVGINTGTAIANASANCGNNGGSDNGSDNGSSSLDGDFGTIASITTLSQYSDEEVGEGESDVKIAGFEVKASNEGDIMITAIKLRFDPTGNTGSTRLDRYVDRVTVWMGSKEIGSADADDFTKNSDDTYSRNIPLKNAIVRSDDTEKFYVTVDAQNNLDSGDISTTNDSWTVGIDNIRYEDGSGVVTTDSDSLPTDIDWHSTGDGISMDFVDFGTAADTEFKISKDSDSPEEGIVIVDDEDGKDNVTLLMGRFRLTGNSDVVLDELPVTFTVGGGYLLSDMASNLTLVIDGEEYTESSATTSGGATSTIVFDNLDFDMSAGDSVDFEVRADVNGTDEFGEGGTLLASITSDNRSAIDLENEEEDQVADSDKTGSAIGEAQEFRSEGVMLSLVGSPTAVAGGQDSTTGTFTIKFKVEAVGDDVYVGTVANSSKYTFAVQDSSQSATSGGVSAVITNQGGNGNSTSTTSGGNWKINEGTSASFTLTLSRADGAAGLFRGVLSGLYWTTSDTDAVTTSDNLYNSSMEDFVTDYLTLN